MLGLSSKELATIVLVLKKFPDVQEAVLFGSRALGTFKPGSRVSAEKKRRVYRHRLNVMIAKVQ